jgi:hypothetical protein
MTASSSLDRDGLAIVPALPDELLAAHLARQIDTQLSVAQSAGIRGLAHKVAAVAALAQSPRIRELFESALGSSATAVESRSPKSNRVLLRVAIAWLGSQEYSRYSRGPSGRRLGLAGSRS